MDKFGMYKKIPGTGESGSYKDEQVVRTGPVPRTGNDAPPAKADFNASGEKNAVSPASFPSAQTYGYAPQEQKADAPLSPKEVGNIIGASQNNSGQNNYSQKNTGNTVFTEKKTSHALKVFLEGQARHERLSKEIDMKFKGGDKK